MQNEVMCNLIIYELNAFESESWMGGSLHEGGQVLKEGKY